MRPPITLIVQHTALIDGRQRARPVDILVSGQQVASILPSRGDIRSRHPQAEVVDASGLTAVPGFIDLHIHGGRGADFMDATEEAFATIAEHHAGGGTTAYLATTATDTREEILACVDMAARCREQGIGGVEILGVHVEGPYLTPGKHGCHDPGYVRLPSKAENKAYLDRAHVIRRITLAPELPGAMDFIAELHAEGVIASGGHSDATAPQTREAVAHGMSMITHLYSAMSSITKHGPFRSAGMLESCLLDDRLASEVILDLKHVPEELVLLALKAKAERTLCFITDAMRGAGMPDGTYRFGGTHGTDAIVEKGIARNPANTGMASSVVRMIDLVRNAVNGLGLSLEAAVRRASLIPAVIAGIANRKGSIESGKDADIVLIDRSLDVVTTIARGRITHRAGGGRRAAGER